MLTNNIRSLSSRTALPMARRAAVARSFTIGEQLGKKERVEEDLYMRKLEKEFLKAKREELAEKASAAELEKFQTTIAPVMAELQGMLGSEKLSNESLEQVAKWKLGV